MCCTGDDKKSFRGRAGFEILVGHPDGDEFVIASVNEKYGSFTFFKGSCTGISAVFHGKLLFDNSVNHRAVDIVWNFKIVFYNVPPDIVWRGKAAIGNYSADVFW